MRVAEVPDRRGEIPERWPSLLLVLLAGRSGGCLAAVLLMDPDRARRGVAAVVPLDGEYSQVTEAEQFGLRNV
jgi:hypothetical protein